MPKDISRGTGLSNGSHCAPTDPTKSRGSPLRGKATKAYSLRCQALERESQAYVHYMWFKNTECQLCGDTQTYVYTARGGGVDFLEDRGRMGYEPNKSFRARLVRK